MMSLNKRLLSAATVVLIVFLGLTGFVLDRAFRQSAETAARDRLQGQIYALLAAADMQTDGSLQLPQTLPEPRFSRPGSGLYARVVNSHGTPIWRSPSTVGLRIPFATTTETGVGRFARLAALDGTHYFSLAFGVAWENAPGKLSRYTFQVTESLDGFIAQVKSFRRSLWGWLAGVAALLLAVQGGILRWGLSPLRKVASDLGRIKSGESDRLASAYPKELMGLTDSINAFIASERSRQNRYRDTLGDLAHSLKTPLAVLRGALEHRSLPSELKATLHEQVDRMAQIVDYQLQRAATSGKTTLALPVPLRKTVQRIVATLDKVYASKNIQCRLDVDDAAAFRGDEGDLLEILGNLLDNAYKWSRSRVVVGAASRSSEALGASGLTVWVEDDGPGVPDDRREAVLQRGVRADQKISGHGIGLAVVQDIVRAYGGSLEVTNNSELGGARITLFFPER